MQREPFTLAVIVGSTREGRRGRAVADWFVGIAGQRPDVDVEVIDLARTSLPHVHPWKADGTVVTFRRQVDRADAFVVVTPEYNHSYPASLKHAIDLARAEWRRKPAAFVSYGGISGGLRAVEHLRHVFAELHATTIRETVSFHGPWNGFGDDGRPVDPASARLAATAMLDELVWWASALNTARAADAAGAS